MQGFANTQTLAENYLREDRQNETVSQRNPYTKGIAAIAYTSVVSSMTGFGENARYKVPIESLIMGLVVFFVYLMVSYRRWARTSAKAG